jgi:hypothetical protein
MSATYTVRRRSSLRWMGLSETVRRANCVTPAWSPRRATARTSDPLPEERREYPSEASWLVRVQAGLETHDRNRARVANVLDCAAACRLRVVARTRAGVEVVVVEHSESSAGEACVAAGVYGGPPLNSGDCDHTPGSYRERPRRLTRRRFGVRRDHGPGRRPGGHRGRRRRRACPTPRRCLCPPGHR